MQEKDQEKHFYINESDKNNFFEGEDIVNAQNTDSCYKGGEEMPQDSFSQGQETVFEKESASGQEKDACEKEGSADPIEYVWNSKESVSYRDGKNENKKAGKLSLITVSVALVLALAVGFGAGFALGNNISFYDLNNKAEITKNNGAVDVQLNIQNTDKKALSRTQVVEMVSDSVVEVTTATVKTDSIFGNYITGGAGSGVVFTRSGEYVYIVTNHHVVAGASSVSVTTSGGVELEAEYLDGDAAMDIAMLRVKTDIEFPKIDYGSSDNLKVGQDVVAIGNPLGELGGTVTEGIISALDRQIVIDGIPMTLLQTSAAVNPGNSGGGLFNMAGELIAIVNAKQSAAGIEGLGFAIPIDTILDSLVEIVESGYIHGRPSLGIAVEYVTDRWEAMSKYSVNATGVFVMGSTNGSILEKDLLYSVNGVRITDETSYTAALASLEIGQTVKIELYRNGVGTVVEATVTEYVPA